MTTTFRHEFVAKLERDWRKRQTNNFDAYRFADDIAAAVWWKRIAINLGAMRIRFMLRAVAILKHTSDLEWTYNHLADNESREWLVAVMSFRALGRKRVKLASNNSKYWQSIERIERDLTTAKSVYALPSGQLLDDFDLRPIGFPITLRGRVGSVLYPFILNQYRLARDNRIFAATTADVVVDAGGCYGDTALYFSKEIGPLGKVYCYEFDPANLKVYDHNMRINPELSARIQLIECALSNSSGQRTHFSMHGASTRLDSHSCNLNDTNTVITDTIDSMVARFGVSKVDLIKMDIEGSELDALKGAKKTILRDRPRLAICLYHQLDHFWEIPQFLDSLQCGYEFRIDHFTIHAEETVLFAEAHQN